MISLIILFLIKTSCGFPLRVVKQKVHTDKSTGRGGTALTALTSNNSSNTREGSFFKRALEGSVRQVTGESDYELGLLGETEEEEPYVYRFGDITKSVLAELSPTNNETTPLKQWRSTLTKKELPIDVMEKAFQNLDKIQRINLALAVVQLAAEGLVLWGLTTNICTLFTVTVSWIATLSTISPSTVPLVPIVGVDKELWRTFTAKYTAVNLVLGPFLFIVKALATLIGFRKYHSWVVRLSTTPWISQRQSWRQYNSVVLNKCIAVITTFFATNIVLTAMAAYLIFIIIGLGFRLLGIMMPQR